MPLTKICSAIKFTNIYPNRVVCATNRQLQRLIKSYKNSNEGSVLCIVHPKNFWNNDRHIFYGIIIIKILSSDNLLSQLTCFQMVYWMNIRENGDKNWIFFTKLWWKLTTQRACLMWWKLTTQRACLMWWKLPTNRAYLSNSPLLWIHNKMCDCTKPNKKSFL